VSPGFRRAESRIATLFALVGRVTEAWLFCDDSQSFIETISAEHREEMAVGSVKFSDRCRPLTA
jgi:hypothetical protein